MSEASERHGVGVRHLFLTAVVLPILLAAISGAWFAWQIARLSHAAEWIDRSDRIIALVGEVQKLVVDEELGLHAFLFAADPAFPDAYRRSFHDTDLDDLEQLAAEESRQATEINGLRDLHEAWQRQAELALANPTVGRSPEALRARKLAVDALRSRTAEIMAEEKSTRLARTRRFERQTRTTTASAVSLLALLAGAASLSSRRQLRTIAALLRREREALEQAREALRARDTFLANLSHELRTPLTPILGWVSLARRRRLDGPALEHALEVIERSARLESQIVDDVLDLSGITAGKLRIAREPVDPGAVVRAALEVVELAAQAKGITLVSTIAAPLPPILGDPVRLQQVAWNLLGNAVKFTPKGGRVAVSVERADGGARIRVSDDGVGISAEFLPHVFEYFRQADASLTRSHGGLGLGLAIVRHLVELHGGEVVAESDGPGRGSTFTVTLPAAGSVESRREVRVGAGRV